MLDCLQDRACARSHPEAAAAEPHPADGAPATPRSRCSASAGVAQYVYKGALLRVLSFAPCASDDIPPSMQYCTCLMVRTDIKLALLCRA